MLSLNHARPRSGSGRAATTAFAPAPRVLVIEPDPGVREWLAWLFRVEHVDVTLTASVFGALTAVREWQPTVAVIELHLPGKGSGAALVHQMLRIDPRLAIVAYTDQVTAARAQRTGLVFASVIKGTHGLDQLVTAVRAAHASYSSAIPPEG